MANQPKLDALRDRIRTAGASSGQGAGIGGVVVDPLANSMTLYWHGQVPLAVKDEIRRASGQGMKIDTLNSAYTESDLEQKSRALMQATAAKPALLDGQRIASAGPQPDGSGLHVGLDASTTVPRAAVTSAPPTASMDVTSAIHSIIGDYPVTIERESAKPTTNWTGSPTINRNINGPGLYNMAGGHIHTASGVGCSTGFAATNSAGHDVVLTAAHCGWDNWYRGDGSSVGRTTQISYTYDGQAISGYSYGDVWLGPDYYSWNGSGQYTAEVVGTQSTGSGDWMCLSGSETGYTCDMQVYRTGDTGNYDGHTWYSQDDVRDKSPNYRQINAEGDSGGPAFFPTTGSTVLAKGLISSGVTESGVGGVTTCTTPAAVGDRVTCWDVMSYTDIGAITSTLGVTIKHW
jgi:streptogrisin A/streptogrisin B